MKRILFVILVLISDLLQGQTRSVLVEAESFQNKGGWVIDQQFMDVMGSPFLMAHGLGRPVEDATTTVSFPKTGKYFLFVRTRNWVAKWSEKGAPGKFQVLLDGKPVNKIFGTGPQSWGWIKGGEIEVTRKSHEIALKDLTGFNGDSVYSKASDFFFSTEDGKFCEFFVKFSDNLSHVIS